MSLLLESPVPMCYSHGARFAMVYNDALAQLLGHRHPQSWAQPMAQVVPEVWHRPRVGPAFEEALRTGVSFVEDETVMALDRWEAQGRDEHAYFVRAGSAVRDPNGTILGVLAVAAEATDGVTRLRAVADLASGLASAVSVDDVVKVALRHALRELDVEVVTVCLPERRASGWRTTTRRSSDVLSADEERLPLIWTTVPADSEDAVVRVAASGKTIIGEAGMETAVVLPLGADEVVGAIGFELSDGLPSGLHVAVLTTCTELVGETLGRARLYDAERRTADLLQRTLLPQLLPHKAGVSIAARYQPVTTGMAAGGDFYDVFEVADGRLAIVIGDVVGRGVAAATVMGQVRAGVRGAALAGPSPGRVFDSLDHLVANLDRDSALRLGSNAQRAGDPWSAGVGGELFVTMLYCLLDPGTGQVVLASAGHLPPVLMRSATGAETSEKTGRTVEFADLDVGPPLGLPGERPVRTSELGEGDALLAFTDGLLKFRDRSLVEGESRLLDVLAATGSYEPRTICQLALDNMVGTSELEDDCALLALVRTTARHRTASAVVPPMAAAVGRTRTWVEQHLDGWNVDPDATWVAVMGVSELVTNVVLHAATDAQVTLDLSPERLLVTVSDTGTRGTPMRMAGEVTATRGRGLGLVAQIAHSCGAERNVSGSTVWFEVLVG